MSSAYCLTAQQPNRSDPVPLTAADKLEEYMFAEGLLPVCIYKGMKDMRSQLAVYAGKIDGTGKPQVEEMDRSLHSGGRTSPFDYINDAYWVYLDKSGQIAFPTKFAFAEPFHDGLARVSLNAMQGADFPEPKGTFGYIDRTGKFVIPPKYSQCSHFREGLAFVCGANEQGYIDKQGKLVVPLKCRVAGNFHDGVALIPGSLASLP